MNDALQWIVAGVAAIWTVCSIVSSHRALKRIQEELKERNG